MITQIHNAGNEYPFVALRWGEDFPGSPEVEWFSSHPSMNPKTGLATGAKPTKLPALTMDDDEEVRTFF